MSEKKEFIPEITINNTSEEKMVEIDGQEQKVEIPPKEGFNIKTRSLEGEYSKEFFLKDLEAVILFDKYVIKSKYDNDKMYFSNEFEFSGEHNKLSVYCPEDKSVIYSGDYAGAKEKFLTGKITKSGNPEKSFDVYSVLYIAVGDEVYRFVWKMNQNNKWFQYKNKLEEVRDDYGYRKVLTRFNLRKEKFGKNEFWVCDLEAGEKVDSEEYDKIANNITSEITSPVSSEGKVDLSSMGTEVRVEDIPF